MTKAPSEIVALLGSEIRRLRLEAGLTQDELGGKLYVAPELVSMIETGARTPRKRHLIEQLDDVLAADGLILRLWEVAAHQSVPGWAHARLEAEEHAVRIRAFEPTLVHGFIQTPEYARAVMLAAQPGHLDDDELAGRLQQRLNSQKILSADQLEGFHLILDEAALHRVVGDRAVMIDQLGRLLEAVKRRQVTVQVLPFDVAAATLAAPMTIYDLDDGSRVVYLERAIDGQTTSDADLIDPCVIQFDLLRSQAAGLLESARIIRQRMERFDHD